MNFLLSKNKSFIKDKRLYFPKKQTFNGRCSHAYWEETMR